MIYIPYDSYHDHFLGGGYSICLSTECGNPAWRIQTQKIIEVFELCD